MRTYPSASDLEFLGAGVLSHCVAVLMGRRDGVVRNYDPML